MKDIVIKAEKRDIKGKEVESLRKEGLLPSSIFGIKGNFDITLNKKNFLAIYNKAKYTTVIEIELGGKKHNVLISEIQVHPVTNDVLHVSFHEISLEKTVKAEVPVKLIGEAPGVKTYGGVLIHSIQELEIESLPGNIPQSIDIDISVLKEIGDTLLVKDITLPKGVVLVSDEEEDLEVSLVSVAAPAEEVEEEETEISPDDVEIINEKKETEETEA